MATRLKPTRINVDNTPRVGDGASYQNDDNFRWSMGGGDMSYRDFEWHTLTGTSLVIEEISNNITPSSDFTVSAGTVKPGIEYVLRVNTGNTPYTMTLGTGVTNPNSYKTELKPNTVNQFKFIATSTNQLELEGVDSAVVSEINWGEIDGTLSDQIDLKNALDQKLDKVTSTATNPRAYVVNADGSQATLPITDSATSGAIVRRNGTQITVPATPSTNTDAASKKYVDDQVSAATAGAVSDTAYGSGWDGVTGIAPSKNAVYDKISAMDTTISGKANDSDVVKLTGDQNIAGTKTFSTSPVVPGKTTDATNSGTAIATEAQVYKKQDTLVSGTNIKTINNETILGSGDISINGILSGPFIPAASATYAGRIRFDTMNNKFWKCDGTVWTEVTPVLSVNGGTGAITVNEVKVSSTAPSSPTEGMVWYDTTNDQLKVYDGTNWQVTGKEYNAGKGIEIKNGPDYSAMQGPAPDGFHVPLTTEWQGLKAIMDGLSLTTSNSWKTNLHMPSAGRRNYLDASLKNQGSFGYYWSSSPFGTSTINAHCFSLKSSSVDADDYGVRAYGYSVRCFKNSYMIPDSSWTVIQGTLGSAGIFWNQSEGLISITNGSTGYTIMDKNLGATAVYNDGDTLTQINIGNMYQWGNNYGFQSTGTISKTSSTKVDTSSYGPTNPYSSDTFITGGQDWSSDRNDNLWGGVTGVVTLDNAITNIGVLSVNGQTGDVTISGGLSVAPNSPITGIKYIWYGTESDYANLSQYYTDLPGDTEFHTF